MTNDITILIGGAAGQGIQTIGSLLARVCHNAGLFIFSMDDFESRIRGGHSFHLLRISDQPIRTPSLRPDILMAIDEKTFLNHKDQVPVEGIILTSEKHDVAKESNIFNIPLEQVAQKAGGSIVSNTVAAGAVLAIIGAQYEDFQSVLKAQFKKKGQNILEQNLEAGKQGFEIGKTIDFPKLFNFTPIEHTNVVMSGAKAAALGALAADCRFFPFYPMSPGTSIVTNAAQYADHLPIVIEQAEDEIAAINMAVGASFAGVRSLVATSGGGFCLMTEGLGLAAMTETPVVIINAQRPGPATGLATRTAQADLLFAINSSQDEFPRFVFAPGGVLETFNTVKKAVYLSEKYQVPSIVLMDQFLIDSARTESEEFRIGNEYDTVLEHDTNSSQEDPYLRYKHTETGVSPRLFPCSSEDLVRSTGNEHTQEGLSFEGFDNREAMVEKRFKKLDMMKEEVQLPSVFSEESSIFLTGWGSSKNSIKEACLNLREEGIDAGWIIFEDIWPMNSQKLIEILQNKKLVLIEGNATCQLGQLIRQQTGLDYDSSILKYDGRPIYPEYIIEKVNTIIGS
ncbi:MAG: 2-oxoacid:acceptor oxidoreductase subunit alpha [Desulfobacteraceae bacterium]|nr:2-oxoacid:acceptor oxidoreductase subunit alpha [Desulfobacteraceae bacterium]